MSECYICGKSLFSDPVLGYLNGNKCKVCRECADSGEFVKASYEFNELFMRFQAQLIYKDNPISIINELLVAKNFDEGVELAKETYPDMELIGLMFDEYCTSNDITLFYNSEYDNWMPQL